MWRFRLSALYCVSTKTRRKSELMQLESVMSMMRYSPPNGTAGFARSRVSGHNRSPCPPASSTPMASFISDMADPRTTRRWRRTFYQQNPSKTQHLPGLVENQILGALVRCLYNVRHEFSDLASV